MKSLTVALTANTLEVVGRPAMDAFEARGWQVRTAFNAGMGSPGELHDLLPGCQAVLAGVEPYDRAMLEHPALSELKVISRWGVGYDSVDLLAATKAGVLVTNTPGLLDEAVADYAWALLLSLARQVVPASGFLREGQWKPCWGPDIHGKTLGVVGCGRIGRAVGKRAQGFGMRLLGYDARPTPEMASMGFTMVDLENLLQESDFVSLHLALTPETRGFLNSRRLESMKPEALLINTSRGPIVDEVALAEALRKGQLGGAALDVFEKEPLQNPHPLREVPNLLLSPHQSSFGLETGQRVTEMSTQAILDALEGRIPNHVVNPQVLEASHARFRL